MKFRIEKSTLKSLAFIALATTILSGCTSSAPKPTLLNVPQPTAEASVGELSVGPFLDERPNSEMGPSYFGTIRGGYGNPLERLQMDKPVSDAVSEVMTNVLRSEGYRTNPAPASLMIRYSGGWLISDAPPSKTQIPLIAGRILSFHASNNPWTFPGGSRNVEIKIEICMLDPQLRRAIWCDTINGSDRDTGQAGISGNSAVMGPWLIRLAGDKTKELVARTSFAKIWKEHISTQARDTELTKTNRIEERLSELRQLFDKKLITEAEYNNKRSEVLKGL